MDDKTYAFDAVIQRVAGQDGAYVALPFDLKAEFGKGRVKVHATFDGEPYDGSAVNMGVKNPDGSVCYIIGILKEIRTKIGKQPGDAVRVTLKEAGGMEEKQGGVEVPAELAAALQGEDEARAFFESLSPGYKRGYCDWVGGAKQQATRETRAGKALLMLQNKQKTLKT